MFDLLFLDILQGQFTVLSKKCIHLYGWNNGLEAENSKPIEGQPKC